MLGRLERRLLSDGDQRRNSMEKGSVKRDGPAESTAGGGGGGGAKCTTRGRVGTDDGANDGCAAAA